MKWKILFSILATAFAHPGLAATYYVDPQNGDDARNGTSTSIGANPIGPWRTLNRISASPLAPGDTILLKCGGVWHESLTLTSSGTATLPFRIGVYPSDCTNAPKIDGAVNVPPHNWVRHSGNIFRTTLLANEVPNGAFDNSTIGWRAWSSNNSATISGVTNCGTTGNTCGRFVSGTSPSGNLAISPRFSIQNLGYTLKVRAKIQSGRSVTLTVRRDSSPWDSIGLIQSIAGNGLWTDYSFSFRSKAEISNARVDFSAPAGVTFEIDDLSVEKVLTPPKALFADGASAVQARHPNPGHDSSNSENPYILTGTDSDAISIGERVGSTYLVTAGDLKMPQGAVIPTGGEVLVRTNAWMIESRRIASVNNTRINFDSPTNFPIKAGWGYFIRGALWMLDSPGEWHFDNATSTLYYVSKSGNMADEEIALGMLDVGVNMRQRNGIIIDGIEISHADIGIDAAYSTNSRIQSVLVSDVNVDGLRAERSTSLTVAQSTFRRIGRDAISGIDPLVGGPSIALTVENNIITDSGVRSNGGAITSVPTKSHAGIRTGENSIVRNNSVTNTGYIGIWPMKGSLIESNLVENSCMVLDDCGAIYVNRDQTGTIIRDNLIVNVSGALHGKPSKFSQGQGIYLDDHTVNAVAESNVVIGADHGIQLHNAAQNRILDNTLFSNRRYQLWLQEKANFSRPSGDVFGNVIQSNVFVPKDTSPAVFHETLFSSTTSFASYDFNRYSSLLSPQIALEQWTGGVANYTLPQWKAASAAGAPRRLDPNASQATLGAAASFRVSGTNLVPNGKLSSGIAGWAAWNASSPFGVLALDGCGALPCVKYTAGSSPGLVYTSNFSVRKDQWYRLSFDIKTGTEGQGVLVGVRRGGGSTNGYEWLMSSPQTLSGSTSWRRHVISFRALKTINANDPLTLDLGARVDFQVKTPGHVLWVKHLEIVELNPVGSSLEFKPIINRGSSPSEFSCPTQDNAPALCSSYVNVKSGAPVVWPLTVAARHAEIIYSRGDTLTDADADGIGDSQDSCPASASSAVDAAGCAINQ